MMVLFNKLQEAVLVGAYLEVGFCSEKNLVFKEMPYPMAYTAHEGRNNDKTIFRSLRMHALFGEVSL